MKKKLFCSVLAAAILLNLIGCDIPISCKSLNDRIATTTKGDFVYFGFESGYDLKMRPLITEIQYEEETLQYDSTYSAYYFTDFIFGIAVFCNQDKQTKNTLYWYILLKADYDGQNVEVFSVQHDLSSLPSHYASLQYLCVETGENLLEIRDYSDTENPKIYFLPAPELAQTEHSFHVLLAEENHLYYEQHMADGRKNLMLATVENDFITTAEILKDLSQMEKISLLETAIEVTTAPMKNTEEAPQKKYYNYNGQILQPPTEEIASKQQSPPTDQNGYLTKFQGFGKENLKTLGEYTFVNDCFFASIWDSENPKMSLDTKNYLYIYTNIDGFSTSGEFLHRFNKAQKTIEYIGTYYFEKGSVFIRVVPTTE